MKVEDKLKLALNETRLLILGAEIFAGFQLEGAFQDAFDTLPRFVQMLDAAAYCLLALAIGLLIAPSMQHRIVEFGEATPRIHHVTTVFAALALLPIAAGFSIDIFIVFSRPMGQPQAAIVAAICFAAALVCWFGLEQLWRRRELMGKTYKDGPTPLKTKVEQLLTESRVLIPGAQALLGFQMAIMLTTAFERLPMASKVVHGASLLCIALAAILLMAPAAFHRISYDGEDSAEFHRLGTRLVVMAALPLASGICGDLFVVTAKVSGSNAVGVAVSAVTAALLLWLWFVEPWLLRQRHGRA